MAVTFELPDEVEQRLRADNADLDHQAKEAMLVEMYRQDKLSHHELAQALELDRLEVDGILKRHNVTEDLPTAEEYNAGIEHLGVSAKP